METFQLVCFQPISEEREKYIWEDLYSRSWDEIIGRMYLLKANSIRGTKQRLLALEQALILLANNNVRENYYLRALNDKAITQCFLGEYQTALETINQALVIETNDAYYKDTILTNRAAILILVGNYEEALTILTSQQATSPKDECVLFTLATCLLHMERYQEAVTIYEAALATGFIHDDTGLKVARLGQQPDWGDDEDEDEDEDNH